MMSRALVLALGMILAIGVGEKAHAQTSQLKLNVLELGAINDSTQLSTGAIQSAIDSCFFNGGGVVYLPEGDFLTGTLILKSNVTLFLEKGARLHASRNIDDYRMPLENATRPILIYANGATNLSIAGEGIIEGHAQHVYEDLREVDNFIREITENAVVAGVEMKRYYIERPDVGLVWFTDCDSVRIEDVTMNASSFWTLHIMRSRQIVIEQVKIYSSLEKGVNADGIDINSCQDVLIKGCRIVTGDDAIALKTWFELPCENVLVTDCELSSSSSAFKIGTESYSDIRNVKVERCKIFDSNRGLGIVVRDGGTVDNVEFSQIQIECKRRHFNWWGNGDPIWILLTKRNSTSEQSHIRNLKFTNIQAVAEGTSGIYSEHGVDIENITFENVEIKMNPESYVDKRATHAFYAEHVKGLEFRKCSVQWSDEEEPAWGSALATHLVDGLTIFGMRARQGIAGSTTPVMAFNETKNARLESVLPLDGAELFLSVTGTSSEQIEVTTMTHGAGDVQWLEVGQEVEKANSIKVLEDAN